MPEHPATVIVVAVGALLVAGVLLAQAQPADSAADLKATATRLLGGGDGAPCDPDRTLTHLLEIAVRIGEDGSLAQPLQDNLESALASARPGHALGDPTRKALGAAYAAFHEGRPYVFPTEVSSIEAARAAGLSELDRSLAALTGGRPQEAVQALLSLLMMVVTPMEART
ncbi:MAG: hypothetical protein AB2L07_00370 [Thermoanaerobaculaceae bacterium]